MKRVGVIGIGNMGTPMAVNLLARGYDDVVCDVSDERVAPLHDLQLRAGHLCSA